MALSPLLRGPRLTATWESRSAPARGVLGQQVTKRRPDLQHLPVSVVSLVPFRSMSSYQRDVTEHGTGRSYAQWSDRLTGAGNSGVPAVPRSRVWAAGCSWQRGCSRSRQLATGTRAHGPPRNSTGFATWSLTLPASTFQGLCYRDREGFLWGNAALDKAFGDNLP